MANEHSEAAPGKSETAETSAPAGAQSAPAEAPVQAVAETPLAATTSDEGGVPELKAQVEQLTTSLENANAEVKQITEAWHLAEDDFEKAKDELAAKVAENADLMTKLSALEASNADLTAKLATADDMVATLKRRTAVGPATVDEAKEILAEAERLAEEEEAARPKRYYAVGVIRDDAGSIQPGTDVSTKFSPTDLAALVAAGAVELR